MFFSIVRHSGRQLEKGKPVARPGRKAMGPLSADRQAAEGFGCHSFKVSSRLRMHAFLALRTGRSRQSALAAARRTSIQLNETNQAVLCEATVTTANPPHPTFQFPALLSCGPLRPAVNRKCPQCGSGPARCYRSRVSFYTPNARQDAGSHRP